MIKINCPKCDNDRNVKCSECGEDYVICDCPVAVDDYYCSSDGTFFYLEDDGAAVEYDPTDINFDDDDDEVKVDAAVESLRHDFGFIERLNQTEPKKPLKSCSHRMDPVQLKTITVYATAQRNGNRAAEDEVPDFGIYLDWGWRPWWRNEMVDWPDFGLPRVKEMAYEQMFDAYLMAQRGMKVEAGCIGAHGRTGTLLACLAVFDGFTADEAIKHIRSTYCSHTIETERQEWFVKWVEARYYGSEAPPEPKAPTYKSPAPTSQRAEFGAKLPLPGYDWNPSTGSHIPQRDTPKGS